MTDVLRKLRGTLGNGLVWSVAWMLGSTIFTIVPALLAGGLPAGSIGLVLGMNGLTGFMTGTVFSLVLGLAYRNRMLDDIRASSIGVAGAVAGLTIPAGIVGVMAASGLTMPLGGIIAMLLSSGALGAAVSVGSLRLARRVRLEEGREPDLLLE